MTLMQTMLEKLKANLILQHDADDGLLQGLIAAAFSYAESRQHMPEGCYLAGAALPAATEQAVLMMASHFYESRDGGTGGFFSGGAGAAAQAWQAADRLLAMNKNWEV